ncbi:DExH-box splicing factor binding site-domain-containing protein [Tribonema minus]|uniref:DExH-box splicing factor binding site-domain-containing protein n=1 Tax=Tribonema minus TaxID=303371 RepID=A0A835ZCA3_9STRA|nr:DExH-box splicing factor binding site-domain-containing protein [Tribonema minus]
MLMALAGAKEKSLDELAAEELVREADEERRQLQRNSRGTDAGLGLDSDRVIAMKVAAEQAAGARKRGILEAAMIPGLNEVAGGDGAKLKHDLAIRAADIDAKSDVYRHVPVEEFGAALLRGMGWAGPAPEDKEGNANPLGTAEPRHHRLGLGAAPKPPEEKHGDRPRKRKPGEKANARDEELRAAWAAKAAAASAAAARLTVGQVVELTATRRRAMVLKTQGVPGLGKIMVRLEQGGAEEAVSRTDMQLVPEDELALKPFTVVRGAPKPTSKRQRSADRGAEQHTSADAKDKKHKHKKKKRSRGDSRSPSRGSDGGGGGGAPAAAARVAHGGWLLESIRVRLVGRQFQKGADAQHYCKKGVSLNVSGDARVTDVRMDSGALLRDVGQASLQTASWHRCGTCPPHLSQELQLFRRHKGAPLLRSLLPLLRRRKELAVSSMYWGVL